MYNQQISKVAFSLIISGQPIYKIKFCFFRILNSVSLELFSSAYKYNKNLANLLLGCGWCNSGTQHNFFYQQVSTVCVWGDFLCPTATLPIKSSIFPYNVRDRRISQLFCSLLANLSTKYLPVYYLKCFSMSPCNLLFELLLIW